MEKENKRTDLSAVICMLILVALELVFSIYTLIKKESNNQLILAIINIVEICGVVFYFAVGYKKPHGNMMKYLMLLFSLGLGASIFVSDSILEQALLILSVILISYVSGRLHKVKQNNIYSIIILVLVLALCVVRLFTGTATHLIRTVSSLCPAVIWITISGAYILRYHQHKEAGLNDK